MHCQSALMERAVERSGGAVKKKVSKHEVGELIE